MVDQEQHEEENDLVVHKFAVPPEPTLSPWNLFRRMQILLPSARTHIWILGFQHIIQGEDMWRSPTYGTLFVLETLLANNNQ